MLAPHWWWPPRVRPLLRARPALRDVAGHLYMRGIMPLPEYLRGVRRAWIMATSHNDVLVFSGEGERFRDLRGTNGVLHAALTRMCTTRVPKVDEPYIGAHVRRGDFGVANEADLRARGGLRTPTSWFVAALRAIRDRVRRAVPLRILSDGTEHELAELLKEPNVALVRTHAPLGDLLVLANSRVLLASGSSFSAWACFLGGMPTATHPGQSVAWFGVESRAFLGEFDPADRAGNAFLDACAEAWRRA